MAHNQAALLQTCIVDCLECYTLCRQAAAEHAGTGRGLQDIDHLRLLDDCAEASRMAADFLLRSSRHIGYACALCANICEACAASCEMLEQHSCAEACRGCARSCRSLVAAAT